MRFMFFLLLKERREREPAGSQNQSSSIHPARKIPPEWQTLSAESLLPRQVSSTAKVKPIERSRQGQGPEKAAPEPTSACAERTAAQLILMLLWEQLQSPW
jgi:hypothetical protein